MLIELGILKLTFELLNLRFVEDVIVDFNTFMLVVGEYACVHDNFVGESRAAGSLDHLYLSLIIKRRY